MNKKAELYSVISRRIKEERKRLNLTQEELAEKVDMSYKYLSNIERNVDKPSLELLMNLAEIFDISVLDLFTEEKKQKNTNEDKNKLLFDKFKYLFSDLSKKQQDYLIRAIKEIKNMTK